MSDQEDAGSDQDTKQQPNKQEKQKPKQSNVHQTKKRKANHDDDEDDEEDQEQNVEQEDEDDAKHSTPAIKKRQRTPRAYDHTRDKHFLAMTQVLQQVELSDISRETKALFNGQSLAVGQMICSLRHCKLNPTKACSPLAANRIAKLDEIPQWKEFVALANDGKSRSRASGNAHSHEPKPDAKETQDDKDDDEDEKKPEAKESQPHNNKRNKVDHAKEKQETHRLLERCLQLEYMIAQQKTNLRSIDFCFWTLFKDPSCVMMSQLI